MQYVALQGRFSAERAPATIADTPSPFLSASQISFSETEAVAQNDDEHAVVSKSMDVLTKKGGKWGS